MRGVRALHGMSLLAVVLGCGGVFTTSAGTVTADVEQHLEAVYGEPFTVHRVNNTSNAGTGFVDRHRFEASANAAPAVVFTGAADYEVDPPRFTDTYRCERIVPLVKAELVVDLAPHVRVANDQVWCDNASLPVHPTRDGDLTALRWDATVHTYTDGDIGSAVAEARALAVARNDRLGLPATEVDVLVFPAALQPSADAVANGFLGQPTRYRAVARAGKPVFDPIDFPTLRRQITDRVEPLLWPGTRFEVTVRVQGTAATALGRSSPEIQLDDVPAEARRQLNAILHVAVFEQPVTEAELVALGTEISDAVDVPWTLHFGRYAPVDGELWAHPEAQQSVGIRYSRSPGRPTYTAPGFVLGPGPNGRIVP